MCLTQIIAATAILNVSDAERPAVQQPRTPS